MQLILVLLVFKIKWQNSSLARVIVARCSLVSQFWW